MFLDALNNERLHLSYSVDSCVAFAEHFCLVQRDGRGFSSGPAVPAAPICAHQQQADPVFPLPELWMLS